MAGQARREAQMAITAEEIPSRAACPRPEMQSCFGGCGWTCWASRPGTIWRLPTRSGESSLRSMSFRHT